MKLSDLPKFKDKESGKCPGCGEKIRYWSEAKKLYKAGLTKELRLSEMNKRLQGWEQINKFIKSDSANSCYKNIKYLEHLAANPVLEPIAKCGLYNLVSYFMSGKNCYVRSQIKKNEQSIIKILNMKNRVQLREAIALNINSEELDNIQTYNDTTDRDRSISDILRIAKEYSPPKCRYHFHNNSWK